MLPVLRSAALSETVSLWQQLGFSEDDALRAVLPMLAGTIETARDKGLAGALAGRCRGATRAIVEKQLALLDGLGGDHAALYALMTRRAVGLARRRPVPPSASALAAIERAIENVRRRA